MKNATYILATILLLAAFTGGVHAQPAIYLGGGPSAGAGGAGNLTVGICNLEATTCALTTFEAHGSLKAPNDLVYAASTGILQVVKSVQPAGVKVDLFTLAQVGGTVTGQNVGINVPLGGGISFHPVIAGKASNWSIAVAGKQIYNTVDSKWKPWVGLQVGYTFR